MPIPLSQLNHAQISGKKTEIDLLLSCARVHTEPSVAEKIRLLLQQNVEWNYLIDLGKYHKVIPLLHQTLTCTCPELLPKTALHRLQSLVHANTYQNLLLTQELLHILALFKQNGIHSIAFKGPTLAISVYGDLSLRQIRDLDILLSKDAIQSAHKLLLAEGYKLTGNYGWQFHFTRDDGKVHIDLHQEIAPKFYNLPFHFEDLWSRTRSMSLGGTTIPHLPSEDLLLLLSMVWCRDCTYLNSHLSLHLLSDIDVLLYNCVELDWSWVLHQARILGCERILAFTLASASVLLETEFPKAILDKLGKRAVETALVDFAKLRLFYVFASPEAQVRKHGFWEFFWSFKHCFYLQTREKFFDKVLYCFSWSSLCLQTSLTPNEADLKIIILPKALYFLYYLIRPARLIFKYILKIFKGQSDNRTMKHL
jgi:hypothetical protein